jgi:hypothetical protein
MKLVPLTLILLATVALSLAYGENGFGRRNGANRQAINGRRGNRRQGKAVQVIHYYFAFNFAAYFVHMWFFRKDAKKPSNFLVCLCKK